MLTDKVLELIKETSTIMPSDVKEALEKSYHDEIEEIPKEILLTILDNINLAEEKQMPICQDTGTLIFHIRYPNYYRKSDLQNSIESAVVEATNLSYLRPNTVDPLTDFNTGDNIGEGNPVYFFDDWDKDELNINLMLKGGGCENCGVQYSLPDFELMVNRDIIGIKKVIIDAVIKAQGRGCSPGILGVGIGGDRVSSYILSKIQLFRCLDDINSDKTLADMEKEILEKANNLRIGPMGFGGKTTLLGVKIGKYHRIPASFFVSISYMCWACRRKRLIIDTTPDKIIKEYRIED